MAEIELGGKPYKTINNIDRLPQDIEWEDVSFKVGNHVILNSVWGKVNAGEIMAVMGPSGKISIITILFLFNITFFSN